MKTTQNCFLNTWINKLLIIFCVALITEQRIYCADPEDICSPTYYLPALWGGLTQSNLDDAQLHLLTDNDENLQYKVLNANGNVLAEGSISSTDSFTKQFPYVNGENEVESLDITTPTRDSGLIIKAEKKITAILENDSANSKHLITGKGLAAIGTEFYAASFTRTRPKSARERHFISVMAIEDNTTVTFYPPAGHRLIAPSGQPTSASFSTTLNALESYIVLSEEVAPVTVSGARVVSDKPITMVSGGRHVQIGSTACQDSGIDQLVPVANLGQEYIVITPSVENSLKYAFVVATQDGTEIYENNNVAPIATINAGEYYEVNKDTTLGSAKRIFTSKPSYVMDVTGVAGGCEVGMALAASLDIDMGSRTIAFQRSSQINAIAIILPDTALASCTLNGENAQSIAYAQNDVPGKSEYEVLYIRDSKILNGQNIVECNEKVNLLHISGFSNTGGRGGYYSSFDPLDIYCDFGDLPDSYSTSLVSDGPSHQLDNTVFDDNTKTSTLMLGSLVDDDEFPFPGNQATGDDLNQVDDEEGITLGPIDPCPVGKTLNIPVKVVNTSGGNATLAGWLDLNQDGAFSANEGKVVNVENGATSKTLTYTLSSCIIPPYIAGRFRISSSTLTTTSFKGFASGGEVEDYIFTVLPYTLSINNCPSPITQTGGAGCSTTVSDVTSGITANYSCGGFVNLASITQTPVAGTTLTGPLTTNIQIVATDDCGISATCTVAMTVNCLNMSFDVVPADANLGCNPSIAPAKPGDVTVVNSCGTPTITVAENSGTGGCTVKLTNTWTARDTCGTTISASQVLTYTNDSQAPVFTSVPADEDLGYNPTITPATPGDVTVTDNCGTPSLTVSSTSTKNGNETTLVNTWTARDACGNQQVATQTLTYKENATQPKFTTVPANRTGCNLSITPATIGDVITVDGCGNKTISLSTTQSTNGCVVTTRYTWTARDECNNTASAEQVITSTNDTQAPVFTSVPADKVLGCNPYIVPASIGNVKVSDNCGNVTVTLSTRSITNECTVTLVNTWTAEDSCGNKSQASQNITYTHDVVGPSKSCPPERVVEFSSSCCARMPCFIPADITDNCTPKADLKITQCPPAGTWMTLPFDMDVIITAEDACGNKTVWELKDPPETGN